MSELLRTAGLIFRKELRVEARSGEVLVTSTLFATLIAVLASMSLYINPQTAKQVAPGVLWIAIAFAGVLAMGRSWAREREHDAFRGLLLSPAPRPALYLGKLAASLLLLSFVEVVLVLEIAVLFNLELGSMLGPLALLLVLGSIGFAATGNLFAALGVRTRARDMLLAVVVFPLVAPALLCGVVGTRELFAGATMAEIGDWIRILAAFDLIILTAAFWLFEALVSD